jgi:hypothetical protein
VAGYPQLRAAVAAAPFLAPTEAATPALLVSALPAAYLPGTP